jgi:hypothetical protein
MELNAVLMGHVPDEVVLGVTALQWRDSEG